MLDNLRVFSYLCPQLKFSKSMGIFTRSAVRTASIVLITSVFSFSVQAQSYKELIEENPDRAGGVYHYYEYSPSTFTKAPVQRGGRNTYRRRESRTSDRRGQTSEKPDRHCLVRTPGNVRDAQRERCGRASRVSFQNDSPLS